MPTYEYACSSCAHEWEAEQSIKDEPLKDCPRCASPTAKRQISRGTGFILKGGGWYADLYSGSSNKAPEKAEKKSDSGTSSGDSGGAKSGGDGSKGSSASSSTSSPSSSPATAA